MCEGCLEQIQAVSPQSIKALVSVLAYFCSPQKNIQRMLHFGFCVCLNTSLDVYSPLSLLHRMRVFMFIRELVRRLGQLFRTVERCPLGVWPIKPHGTVFNTETA